MTQLVLRTYAIVCLGLIAAAALLLGYWAFWPMSVVQFKVNADGSEIDLLQDSYYPGDLITYRTAGEVFVSGVRGEQSKTLVNDVLIFFTPTLLNTNKGKFDLLNSSAEIPPSAPPGVYRLQITNRYKVNPIREQVVTRLSPPFKVLQKP